MIRRNCDPFIFSLMSTSPTWLYKHNSYEEFEVFPFHTNMKKDKGHVTVKLEFSSFRDC